MPLIQTFILKGRPREQVHRLIAAMTDTVARVIESPKERLRVWVSEIEPGAWGIGGVPVSLLVTSEKDEDTEMPLVQITLLEGRSKEQHHRLIAAVTEVVEDVLLARKDRIRVSISEVKPDSFGIGGVPASIVREAEIRARAEKDGR